MYADYMFQYWENRLVSASIFRILLPKRNRRHRTTIDVFKTNVFEALTFAIKRIWHRHVYPASRTARCFIFEVYCDEEIFSESTCLYDTLFHTYLQCPECSILIFLFRNERFWRVPACQSVINHECLSSWSQQTYISCIHYQLFVIKCSDFYY